MNVTFVLAAALMTLAALACIALPLLRHRGPGDAARRASAKRRALDDALAAGVIDATEHAAKLAQIDALAAPSTPASPSRSAFAVLLASVFVLPAAAIVLYLTLGNPAALDPEALKPRAADETQHGPDMERAIAGLVEKLKSNPEDVNGWMLLGRAQKSLQRFAEARDALKHAYDLAHDEPEIKVEYAEALALASEHRRIDGEALKLLEEVLAADPNQQRALWLLGIADYQAERWAQAVARWETLKAQLPPESDIAQSVTRQIADARARAGMPPAADSPATAAAPPAATSPDAGSAADANAPRLQVKVALDAKLKDQAAADDVVFVFAKAAQGPPMPLAVQRLRVGDLPASVTLTDGMGMMPNLKLSQFPQVIVGARVSKSGNAVAQSGDLQALSGATDVHTTQPIALTIDQVVK